MGMINQVVLFPRNVYPSYAARLGIKLFDYPLTLRTIGIGSTSELEQIDHPDVLLFVDGATMKNNKRNVCIREHISAGQGIAPENIYLLTSQADLDAAFKMIKQMKEAGTL